MPPEVQELLDFFSIVVTCGLGSIGGLLACVDLHGYVAILAVYMATPILLGALLLLCGGARLLLCEGMRAQRQSAPAPGGWPRLSELFYSTLPLVLKVLFVSYPLVTTFAFDAWACVSFVDPESRWLKLDVAIECASGQASD